MENVKKQLQENQTFRNMFIAFVTFFLMIVAIMTNSIVSAYSINVDKDTYTYKNFYSYVTVQEYKGEITTTTNYIYFNDFDYIGHTANGTLYHTLNLSNGDTVAGHYRYDQHIEKSDGTVEDKKGSFDYTVAVTLPHLVSSSKYGDYVMKSFHTNNQTIYNYFNENIRTENTNDVEVKYNPELLTPDKMKGLTTEMTKTTKVIIPVGLVIFGLILGVFLIKRLVGYFL